MTKKISFEVAFAESASESIQILGDVVSNIVTDYLESKYSIRLTRTADNPKAFDEALDHVIDGGKTIVERKLVNLLYKKLRLDPISVTNRANTNLFSFEEKVNEARRRYSK